MKYFNQILTFFLNLSVLALAVLIIKNQDSTKYASQNYNPDQYNQLLATNEYIAKLRNDKMAAFASTTKSATTNNASVTTKIPGNTAIISDILKSIIATQTPSNAPTPTQMRRRARTS